MRTNWCFAHRVPGNQARWCGKPNQTEPNRTEPNRLSPTDEAVRSRAAASAIHRMAGVLYQRPVGLTRRGDCVACHGLYQAVHLRLDQLRYPSFFRAHLVLTLVPKRLSA